MAAEKLDDKLVKALEPPASGYTIVWDTEVKGLGVRVTTAGAKSFVLEYRVKAGPKAGTQRRHTIGDAGDWSTVAARNEAKRLKRLIDEGQDPVGERKAARQAPTVADLCARYLAEHVDIHNKPRTRAENRRMVEQIIKPKIGRLKVGAVEYDDVARLHRDLKATPRQANHIVAVLSKMFNLAERWKGEDGKTPLRPLNSNPCRHINRYPENERDRYPEPEELERIGNAMREMESEGALLSEDAACIRFLALVGCRLNEAVDLDLAKVNFRTGAWTRPDKDGTRTVMLGAPALALLASLGRIAGRAFVRQDGRPLTVNMIEKAWGGDKAHSKSRKKSRPGIRDRAGVPDLRVHDLRHGVGTYAGAGGYNAFIVRDLLGHKTMAMTGRYVSKQVDPLRAAADAIAGQIDAAMSGTTAEVVSLPKAGRR
jgi:integrase